MRRSERDRFDLLFDRVVSALPSRLRALLEEAPVIVDDRPTPELLAELGIDSEHELLCGLHTGVPLTDRSVDAAPELPDVIHLFREGIIDEAGGWEQWEDEEGRAWGGEDAVQREIRITLLHEIGHHFGLSEEDLDELGYA